MKFQLQLQLQLQLCMIKNYQSIVWWGILVLNQENATKDIIKVKESPLQLTNHLTKLVGLFP